MKTKKPYSLRKKVVRQRFSKPEVEEFVRLHSDWSLLRHSKIHWSMIAVGRRIDFWPTTGSWFDMNGAKGKGWESLKEHILTPVPPVEMDCLSAAELDPETPPW